VKTFVESITDPTTIEDVLGVGWWKEQLYTGTREDGFIEIDRRLPSDVSYKAESQTMKLTLHWVLKNQAGVIQA
jgi:hypothetical protein